MNSLNSTGSYKIDNYDYSLYELNDSPWKIYAFAITTNNTMLISKFDIYRFVQIVRLKYDLSGELYVS